MSDRNAITEEEIEERKRAFCQWYERRRKELKLDTLLPKHEGLVYDAMKKAYCAGSNFERRKHVIIEVGGVF